MVRSITKCWVLCTVLWCAYLPGKSQEPAVRTKRSADSLSLNGARESAALLYQKLAFLSKDGPEKAHWTLEAARQLKLHGDFAAGAQLLQRVSLEGQHDTLVFQVMHETALLYYLDKKPALADHALLRLNYLVRDSSLLGGSCLLHALVLNELGRWQEASEKARCLESRLAGESDSLRSRQLDVLRDLYHPRNHPKLKNPEKAATLSTWIPGAGQVYAGSPGEAVVNVSAILFTGAAMVAGVVYQYYFTSIVLGNLVIGKFYQGGITRAEFLAHRKNYKRSLPYNQKLREQLLALYGN